MIAQNEQILGDGFGGIFVVDDLTDTEVIIGQATVTVDGTPTAFGGNGDIVGVVSGVTVDGITGGSVTVANNTLIRGRFAFGIFADDITADALFAVVGNTEIRGGDGRGDVDFDNGISINSAKASTIVIAGNDGIFGDGSDGIRFGSALTDATVVIGAAEVDVNGDSTIDSDEIFGGNTITAARTGINVEGAVTTDTGTATFDITGNTIGASDARVGADGIAFAGGIAGNATVTIGGDQEIYATDQAIEVAGLTSPTTLSITGGTYNATGGALRVDNTGVAGTDGRLVVGDAAFVGGPGSTVMQVLTDGTNAGVDIDFSGAATFDVATTDATGTTGVLLSGPGIDILNDTLGSIAFLKAFPTYIELANGAEFAPGQPTVIDATGVTFDALDPSDPDDRFALERQIVHYLDADSVGLLRVGGDGKVYADESIQLAVNAAGFAGADEVLVLGGAGGLANGAYRGSVEIWVDGLTITGVEDASGEGPVIDTDAVDVNANNGDADNGFQIMARSALSGGGDVSSVTIDGFAFTGSGGTIGVELGEFGVSTAVNATVQNSRFTDLEDGVVANDVSGTTTVSSVVMTGIDRNGIRFDPLLAADDTILIENSTITGVFDAVRFSSALIGTDVTVRGNTIEGRGDGIEFAGAIGSGSEIAITGNTRIEGLGTFIDEDGLADGIVFRGAVSGAATSILIDDNTLIRGDDRGINFASSRTGGPATVTDASVTISRNDEIRGTEIDGILFNAGLTNATIVIGGPTAADRNGLIIGGDDGIDIENVIGGSFTIANNERIEGGVFNAIEFEGPVSDGAEVAILSNGAIEGDDNGVIFDTTVDDSTVTIAGNTAITGDTSDGIRFAGTVTDATVAVITNTVSGGGDGIDIAGIAGDAAVTLTDNTVTFGSLPANAVAGPLDPADWNAGIRLANVTSTVPVAIIGGSITGLVDGGVHLGEIGVLIDNAETPTAADRGIGDGNGTVLMDGVEIAEFSIAGVYVETNQIGTPAEAFADGNGIVLGLRNGVVIASAAVNAAGLWINGPETFLADPAPTALGEVQPDVTLNDTTFDLAFSAELPDPGATGPGRANGNFIYLENFALWNAAEAAPFVVDASDVTWTSTVAGVTTTIEGGEDGTFTLDEINALTARIRDDFDGFDVGLIFVEPGIAPFLAFFGLAGFGIDPTTPGDATFRSGELAALLPDIFAEGFGLGEFASGPATDGGLGGLEPAAGGDTEGIDALEPAAGGDDACVETFFADYWTVATACEIVGGDQTAALQ